MAFAHYLNINHAMRDEDLCIIGATHRISYKYPDRYMLQACKYARVDVVRKTLLADEKAWENVLASRDVFAENVPHMLSHHPRMWNLRLREACYGGNLDIVKMILQYDVTEIGKGLEGAYHGRQMHIVDYLINERCANELSYGLSGAVLGNHADLIHDLLDKGVYPSPEIYYNAFIAGNMDIIQLLNTNYEPIECQDALYGACYGNHPELIEYAITCGASDFDGGLLEASHAGHMDIVEMMLSKGADIREELVGACRGGNVSYVKELLDRRIGTGYMSMWCACYSQYYDVGKLLLPYYDANTILRAAAQCGCISMVYEAIRMGADDYNGAIQHINMYEDELRQIIALH